MPRLRNAPSMKEALLTNLVAYKAGMTHLTMIDDTEGPAKNQEVARACTVLEVPRMEVYGIRMYGAEGGTKYRKTRTEFYSKAAAQKLGIKNLKNDESKLEQAKGKLADYTDISALIVAYPKDVSSVEQHHPMRFESRVGGSTVQEKFDYVSKLLGKEVKMNDIFKPGEFIDVSTVTTGKGWAGVIKRHGVHRNAHKATNKIRHGGPLGSFGDGRIFFTVPRAGQMGFNYRTEHNKRILKIGQKADTEQINQRGGFQDYGVVKNDFVVVDGSIGGTTKRLVRIRKSIRERNATGIKEPRVLFIAK